MSEKSVLLGHRIVIIVIVLMLLTSAMTLLLPLLIANPIKITAVIRFALTAGLCWQLYQGKVWARVVSIILLTIAGLQSLIGGVSLLSYGSAALIVVVIGTLYLGAALALSIPRQVRHYFAYIS